MTDKKEMLNLMCPEKAAASLILMYGDAGAKIHINAMRGVLDLILGVLKGMSPGEEEDASQEKYGVAFRAVENIGEKCLYPKIDSTVKEIYRLTGQMFGDDKQDKKREARP